MTASTTHETTRYKRYDDSIVFEFNTEIPRCPECGSGRTGWLSPSTKPERFACAECDTLFTGMEGPEPLSASTPAPIGEDGDESRGDREANDDVPTNEPRTPHVRYKKSGGSQLPELRPIDEPIPDDAECASPIYSVTEDQIDRQRSLDEPYATRGTSCIANELQDECEDAGAVSYPVYAEVDDPNGNTPGEDARDALVAFVRKVLDIDPDDCRWFYSGNRSLHVHVPLVVTTGDDLDHLREQAQMFNEGNVDAEIDSGIYTRKRQFRLPGVDHHETGLPKVEIDHRADNLRVEITHAVKEATEAETSSTSDTFAEVIEATFGNTEMPLLSPPPTAAADGDTERCDLLRAERHPTHHTPPQLYRAHDAPARRPRVVKKGDLNQSEISRPLIEAHERPDDDRDIQRWKQVNRTAFAPGRTYPDRSVCLATIKGTPLCRGKDSHETARVPAYIPWARAGSEDEGFTIDHENCPLRLPAGELTVWDVEVGETVVIVGHPDGTIEVTPTDALVPPLLSKEHHNQAMEIFDAGGDPAVALSRAFERADVDEDPRRRVFATLDRWAVIDAERTARLVASGGTAVSTADGDSLAARLQRQAETGDVRDLMRVEHLKIANRLLASEGWNHAVEWFRRQYADGFDREETCRQLGSICERYKDLPDAPEW